MSSKRIAWTGNGALVIMAVVAILSSAAAPRAWAAKYKTLYKFHSPTDGRQIYGGVVLDGAGNLYGTTTLGGIYDRGIVFQLTREVGGTWKESVLHSFNNDGQDGIEPTAGLVLDQAGNLYGTTTQGGTFGDGTVFELSPNGNGTWTESILHSFHNDLHDGSYPFAAMTFDAVGNLYGTTRDGGRSAKGTVFELSPNGDGTWKDKVLHSFANDGKDGQEPFAAVIFDAAGNLYSTTLFGGTNGNGTVFQLTPNGHGTWKEKVLHSFVLNHRDGYGPFGGVTGDLAGNLYGATTSGGTNGTGAVFLLSPSGSGSWKEKVLYSFQDDGKDGNFPDDSLVLDAAGNLYGTTNQGGVSELGTVFKLKAAAKDHWEESVLHSFTERQGHYPNAGLIPDGHGSLYGTTLSGNRGTVFQITP